MPVFIYSSTQEHKKNPELEALVTSLYQDHPGLDFSIGWGEEA
jgi:hypothetical protein